MRFPGMPWMDRVIGNDSWSLLSYVNARASQEDHILMIKYIFETDATYRLFNNHLVYNNATPSAATFDVLSSEGGPVSASSTLATQSAGAVLNNTLQSLVAAFRTNFSAEFDSLMEFDGMSLREYLIRQSFTARDVDWMETFNDATTHYDTYSVAQAVLEQWIFNSASLDSWTAMEEGIDRITHGMANILKNPPVMNKRVVALVGNDNGTVTANTSDGDQRNYAHIINTVPLGVMQNMDMSTLNLDYNKTFAIRKLQYDPAGKIGMTFKKRWWEDNFKGGQSFSDLSIRRCVYPSYGVNVANASAAMIASYTWGQDSARLGSYYHNDADRDFVTNLAIRELAAMNNVTETFLRDQLIDTHMWDWYGNGWSAGAFAVFGPAEFSTMMPSLMQPAFGGKVHFAGEALSSGHAWIIGAVNSAYRTVVEVLSVEGLNTTITQMQTNWGTVDEVDMGWYQTE